MGSIVQPEAVVPEGIPDKQTAIVIGPKGEYVVRHDVGVIPLESDAVLVKVACVSLNPVDTKMLGDFAVPDAILGLDCAGTVVAVGSQVTKFKVGDRACGSADCMNKCRPLGGAFAEYISFIADLALKIPDNMSFETASTVGTPIASMTVGCFHQLGISPKWLEKPTDEPFTVLVYGGSTATGTMIMQFLKVLVWNSNPFKLAYYLDRTDSSFTDAVFVLSPPALRATSSSSSLMVPKKSLTITRPPAPQTSEPTPRINSATS